MSAVKIEDNQDLKRISEWRGCSYEEHLQYKKQTEKHNKIHCVHYKGDAIYYGCLEQYKEK